MREEIPINENMGEEIINEIEEELLDEEGSEGSEGSESSELSEDIDDEKAIIRLGDEYIDLMLEDSTGSIRAKVWSNIDYYKHQPL